MKMVRGLFGIALMALLLTTPALSHHSFAMYDQTKTMTVSGKLVRYVPGANHVQMNFIVVDQNGSPTMKDGKQVQWGVEMGSATAMARQGVTPKSFSEGTIFTVSFFPLRDGRNFGAMTGQLIKCGAAMPKGGCTAETGQVLTGRNFSAQ
jgi:hypothetical protein